MSEPNNSPLEIGAPRAEYDLCVILMHGLGADCYDFADVAAALCKAAEPRKWRFVLPNAPVQKVTINMGMHMPAWYDILDLSHPRDVNWDTVRQSEERIAALLDEECSANGKLVLAGFSQGGAMALHVGLRHQERISGILSMSGYLLESEDHKLPARSGEVDIGFFHGDQDPVVPFVAAEQSIASLRESGYQPQLNIYSGMEHSVCDEEIVDVLQWLRKVDTPS